MEYVGAAEFYFWQGVQMGNMSTKHAQPSDFAPTFSMVNDVTKACLEAFTNGFCLGLAVTEEEFAEMIAVPEREVETFIETKPTTQPKMVGNC